MSTVPSGAPCSACAFKSVLAVSYTHLQGDKVISCVGKDVTKAYTKGAETALYFAKLNHVDFAVMKAKSPSCGKGLIYDGTFTGNKIPGNGVTVELLNANGIPVFTEDELDQLPL